MIASTRRASVGVSLLSLAFLATAPGIRMKVSGRVGVPANAPSAMPVEVVVTLGDQAAALAGSCGESTFDATSCQYRGPSTFQCRK